MRISARLPKIVLDRAGARTISKSTILRPGHLEIHYFQAETSRNLRFSGRDVSKSTIFVANWPAFLSTKNFLDADEEFFDDGEEILDDGEKTWTKK